MKHTRMSWLQAIGAGLGFALLAGVATAQSSSAPVLAPDALKQPLSKDWASYSGDYTGQRYSRLTQVTPANVKTLTLAWTARMSIETRGNAIVGGEGKGDFPVPGAAMRGTVLEVNGILYATSPDHVWAIDGRDGRELWHYFWKTRGSTHIGNRPIDS